MMFIHKFNQNLFSYKRNEKLSLKNGSFSVPSISSHFSILSPNRIKIPMASIIDSRLCRYVTTMTFTPE